MEIITSAWLKLASAILSTSGPQAHPWAAYISQAVSEQEEKLELKCKKRFWHSLTGQGDQTLFEISSVLGHLLPRPERWSIMAEVLPDKEQSLLSQGLSKWSSENCWPEQSVTISDRRKFLSNWDQMKALELFSRVLLRYIRQETMHEPGSRRRSRKSETKQIGLLHVTGKACANGIQLNSSWIRAEAKVWGHDSEGTLFLLCKFRFFM
jgi:CRISPR/Cas system-associated protein endoribonuclease Cas2